MQMLRNLLTWAPAVGTAVILLAGAAGATPINGVEVPGAVPPPGLSGGSSTQPAGCGAFINFDEAAQPCFFIDANPLRNEYLGFGVTFSNPNPNGLDGGAILDECGNFGVTGHSSPNFLAINCSAGMMNGGFASPPEYLDFPNTASFVGLRVGSGAGQGIELSMEAYDVNQQLVDSDSVILTPAMQTLLVSGPGISRVVVGVMGPCIWVLDDLCFDSGATPVEASTWGAVKATFK